LYVGCGAKHSTGVKGHEKTFNKEDIYILIGLRAEQLKDYNASSNIFSTLYEKTDKKEYLYRSLRNDLVANKNEKVIKRVDKLSKKIIDDFALMRIKIIALVNQDN
jgi:hypothetical protein